MMNEYTDKVTMTVHNQTDMTAVSFSGFSALNVTVYSRIFIWGVPPATVEPGPQCDAPETDWSRIRVSPNHTVSNCDRFCSQNL